jgi:hypothetical protein
MKRIATSIKRIGRATLMAVCIVILLCDIIETVWTSFKSFITSDI